MECDLVRKGPNEFLKNIFETDEKRESVIQGLFPDKLTVIEKALKVQLQGFKTFYEDDTGATFRIPAQQLLARLFNNQLAARKLLLMGYVTEAASVLARAMETSWLARYFDCYPDEVDKWWMKKSNKKEFSPQKLREGLKKAYDEGLIRIGNMENENILYQDLCEIGHPNFFGSAWHLNVLNESPLEIELILGGYGGQKRLESLKVVFNHFLRIQRISIGTIAAVHSEFLDKNPIWDAAGLSIIKELTNCIDD